MPTHLPNIKQRMYAILNDSGDAGIAKAFNLSMLVLITLNVFAVILETEEALYQRAPALFIGFDTFSVIIFTIEYALRLWTCTLDPRYRHPVTGRLRLALTPLMLIDLLAFLPFYLPFVSLDLRFLRAIRLFRLFRLLKMGRYSQSLRTLTRVVRSKKEELLITVFAGLVVLLIISSIMYLVEHHAQPDVFSSIPASMWWVIATLTTVGYGDIYPKTSLGKVLGGAIAMLGVAMFALPAGIIASGFAAELEHRHPESQICPHCGKDINARPEADTARETSLSDTSR